MPAGWREGNEGEDEESGDSCKGVVSILSKSIHRQMIVWTVVDIILFALDMQVLPYTILLVVDASPIVY